MPLARPGKKRFPSGAPFSRASPFGNWMRKFVPPGLPNSGAAPAQECSPSCYLAYEPPREHLRARSSYSFFQRCCSQQRLPTKHGNGTAHSHFLGRKPKGQNRLPIDSHYLFLRVPEGSFECHSCLVINYIANAKYAHNPKVGGSNPSPATNPINRLHGFVSAPKLPLTPNSSGRIVLASDFLRFAAV
jgi:hypothetical protein